jgi:ribose/xylose/arabinose/galactoside ABC-type transport system permease subunit
VVGGTSLGGRGGIGNTIVGLFARRLNNGLTSTSTVSENPRPIQRRR